MNRFQVYKIVRNNRKMHIMSLFSENRITAISEFKKEHKWAIIGFKFWNYYITGLMQNGNY